MRVHLWADYHWNWLHTLNRVLDGTMFGLGLLLALALFHLLSGNKDKKKEAS